MIKIKRLVVEPTDVYDITVPETECFFANDILVHNCMEILLPTKPFQSIDDEGEFKIQLDNGEELTLAGQHKVLLTNGTMKKVRELNELDDIDNLLL
jgi:intein/homing endonuclease